MRVRHMNTLCGKDGFQSRIVVDIHHHYPMPHLLLPPAQIED